MAPLFPLTALAKSTDRLTAVEKSRRFLFVTGRVRPLWK
jgi:hypothetical protein